MATLVARYCRKTSQPQSVLGLGMQRRTHKNIYNRFEETEKVLPWQQLLPGIAKKLSRSNPCRGMECKEPTKIFIYGSKKQKKSVAMATLVARYCRKTNLLQSVQGYGMQRTHKIIYKSKKQKKSVAMANLVARYCRKSNQLQSMQEFGMQRTNKKIFQPKKHEKMLTSTHKITI